MSKINAGDLSKIPYFTEDRFKDQKKRVQAYRKEASRKASLANKRIDRLAKAGLVDNPTYKKWVADGSVRFGVRGKTHNELQAEVSRMNGLIKSKTSTIRGTNKVLKEMAENTGIKYKNLTDLHKKSGQFFELASKVEQYLDTVDDMGTSIGYQKIWTAVNEYVTTARKELGDSGFDIEKAIKDVSNAIQEFEIKTTVKNDYAEGWFQLPKK